MVLLGVDYGRRRTGMAVCVAGMVLPSEPVLGTWMDILDRLDELRNRYGEVEVVLGHPLSALGKPTELSAEVEVLAERIRERGFKLSLVNEARSSREAVRLTGRKDRKGHVDSLAACEILKRYLNIL